MLCRSGQVTDIRVIEGISPEINEFARAAVSLVEFEPAEIRWHSVSTRTRFELVYGPNEPGIKDVTATDAAKRLVESVDIIGNRRLTAREILSWIRTRPGDPYDEEKLKRDFAAVLGTGQFDKTQTRVMIEDGVRGGVRVIFEVVELPVIGEVNFENLKVERSVVLAALKKEQIDLLPGKPCDVTTVKRAVRIIKFVLAEIGQPNSNVETKVENVSATKVNLTFVITPNQ
ncbi:MAG: POTRA domain-containing protein [Pyrinomonadaceae bacterium]